MNEGSVVRAITGTVYETLGRVDPQNPSAALRPWLAESWSGDKTLTVKLKPGVTFHDGSTLTSADVKAVLRAILDEKNSTAAMRAALGPIESVATPDAQTLTVTWRTVTPFFHRALLGAVPAMPAKALEGVFDDLPIHTHPVGTGPFRVESFIKADRLELKRFEAHRTPAFVSTLTFRFVKDDLLATQLWEKGAFDVMTRIPPVVWRSTETADWASTGYQRVRFEENAYAFFMWNLEREVFRDVRVRRALAMLYPAELISKNVELSLESRTSCPFLQTSVSCDETVRPLPFDPTAAQRLLDEAGFRRIRATRTRAGKPLRFTYLMLASSARAARMIPLFQEQLALAGVEMNIESVDGAALMARLRAHDFDAAALSWSTPDAVSDQFEIFHSSQAKGGKNYGSFANPTVDAVLERIRSASDERERVELERQLHRVLYAEQPYLFLTARPGLDAIKRRVHGLSPSLAGYDFAQAWVDE
jgi:peptide/nickel transport system substrate-binding protein